MKTRRRERRRKICDVLGPDTQEVVSFMVCLGDAHMKLNRFMESKVIFEDALQIYQKLDHDLVHVDVPDLLYSLSPPVALESSLPLMMRVLVLL
jgi:hypothetical protein